MTRTRTAAFGAALALAGALVALGVARAGGWLGNGHRTVVIQEVVGSPADAKAGALTAAERPLLGNGFDPAALYTARSPGVVTIFSVFGTKAAQGSGFVVSPTGYILTNSHVITDAGEGSATAPVHPARQLYVEFADHDRIPAHIVGWDVFDDVGVVRVDPRAHALAPVPLGVSRTLRVGEPVAAIGSPFGNENSLTVGVVSAVHRSIQSLTSTYDLVDAIQVDAAINHGNSGGPLFDAGGHVIGINAQIRSDTGTSEGIGFAVPIDSARRSLNDLISLGRVSYAYVGITTEDVTPTLAHHLGLPVRRGALVDTVLAGRPAAAGGLRGGTREEQYDGLTVMRGGDVIVAIAGRPVGGAEDVVRIVSEDLRPGQRVPIVVYRGAKRLVLPVRLTARPGASGGR